MSNILHIQELSKSYRSGTRDLIVLHDVSFSIPGGSTCAVVGPSGSGKTTLLGLCAGLDHPSAGSVHLNDTQMDLLDEDDRALLRNQCVGFVFQNFQLIPTLTALENVMVPLELRGESRADVPAQAWLERVGLGDRMDHYPVQLSGGTKIGRAHV